MKIKINRKAGNYNFNTHCVRDGEILIAVIIDPPESLKDMVDVSNFGEGVDFKKALEMLKCLSHNIYHSNTKRLCVISTHNTALISNEILRPDCYFVWDDKKQEAFSFEKRTNKELREENNLEKMYRAGAFS